ncbi:hypothetical protein K4F52_000359 [Lecanicillium sp. MT-2017a]|nr:hypothetical protein K4F52_000359 [Lecanicillium sp. MT-2017a]
MSPKLKPLLLPQLVDGRTKQDAQLSSPEHAAWPYALTTTNSSSSDITSPITPTFSTRGHARMSSSSSSLDLPPLPPLPQDGPVSPSLGSGPLAKTGSVRQLPDVKEEPMERENESDGAPEYDDEDEDHVDQDSFGLYSCLCDHPCNHPGSTDDLFPGAVVSDFDIDYDIGFLSDSDFQSETRFSKKKRSGIESPLSGLTARLESRFPTITRWRSGRRSRMTSAGTNDYSLDNVLSRAPSSRSSSISAAARHADHLNDSSIPPTPALPQFGSSESVNMQPPKELTEEDRAEIVRDRAMTGTPLLPPMMTVPAGTPPQESPLQSPTIESAPSFPSAVPSAVQSPTLTPAMFTRPPLSSRPSTQSLRNVSSSTELPPLLPLGLPSILQEHDEWSDRLGHANFTITPVPYELEIISPETVAKFQSDWDAARVNYTKHLVRTGENYGQTSKIYGLTEAKWAETEKRWKSIYGDIISQTYHSSAPPSKSASRSRSRGRNRGRSLSAHPGTLNNSPNGDAFAGIEWKRLEDHIPGAVPQTMEAMDAAQGKFPGRGDEDIVGPMHREATMIGAYSEDSRSRFWKSLAEKVRRR